MQGYLWSVVLLTHTYAQKILSQVHLVTGDFGSPYHFHFCCPRCAAVRNTYLYDFLQTHLLYGKGTATDEENQIMFLHV